MSQLPGEAEPESPPRTPRWVKVFGIIVLVVVLLFVISLLAGVQHGPGLHTPPGSSGGQTLPAILIGSGVQLP